MYLCFRLVSFVIFVVVLISGIKVGVTPTVNDLLAIAFLVSIFFGSYLAEIRDAILAGNKKETAPAQNKTTPTS